MRPVNLLPDELRPRQRSSEGRGPAHVVLGVLGLLLLLAVVYSLSLNQVNSRKTDIARAKDEIETAKARISASTAFGDFHQIKEDRVASVKQLAGARFDWERLMRELALVLPARTWLLHAAASTSATGATAAPGAAPSAPPPAAAASAAASTGAAGAGPSAPTLNLSGCTLHQKDVAVVLVRLRKLHGVDNVDLSESAQEITPSGAAAGGEAAGGSDSCGSHRFKFDVAVTFAPAPEADKPEVGKVPAKLGGGS